MFNLTNTNHSGMFSLTYANYSCMFNFTYTNNSSVFNFNYTSLSCMFKLPIHACSIYTNHSSTFNLTDAHMPCTCFNTSAWHRSYTNQTFDANTMFLLGLQTQNPENATMLNTIVLIMPCVNLFCVGLFMTSTSPLKLLFHTDFKCSPFFKSAKGIDRMLT